MKDRIVTRSRGCWNCISFCNDDIAKKHFRFLRMRDRQAAIAKGDFYVPPLYDKVEAMIDAGAMGICLQGKGKGDIKHHQFLCDSWSGKTGSSIATEGQPLDALPDELESMTDERLRKKRMID